MRHRTLTLAVAALMTLSLSACGGLLGSMMGPPPQLPPAVQTISRTALDFSLNAFDGLLYGLDWAMDAGKLQPGSQRAKQIASAGRTVMKFLGVAEAARDMGSAATYEEAFRNAKTALDELRSLMPAKSSLQSQPPLTNAQRLSILDRLERGPGAVPII